MKHAILGAGAIGGLIGTVLSSLGEDVTMIVRQQSLSDYPANLSLERPSSPLSAPAKAVSALTDPPDVLWIATKTYQMEPALENVRTTPRSVVPLLNGIDHVAVLRSRFGHDRVIPGTIAVEAEKAAPGRFIQRSPVVRFNLAASGEPLLGAIVAQLSNQAFACKFIANEQTLLWGKLCFLGPFALATSASGMNIGEILADTIWKQKLHSAIAEACAVANASGAGLDVSQLQKTFESAPPTMRSSMQKDLVAGRQLELDAIGGPIVRGGKHYGIDVPTTKNLIESIEEEEEEEKTKRTNSP
jgi:2-dehydropantoate 2-reductase